MKRKTAKETIKGDDARADLSAVVPARAFASTGLSPGADLSNVVPFVGRRTAKGGRSAPEIVIDAAMRPIRALLPDRHSKLAALIAGSVLLHGAILAAFNREPAPLASVGLVAINVELTLGANTPAGQSEKPNPSEVASAASPKNEAPPAPTPETARNAPEPSKPEPAQSAPAETQKVVAAPPIDPDAEQSIPKKVEPTPSKLQEEPVKDVRNPAPEKQIKHEAGKSAHNRAAPASTPSVASNSIGRGRSDADTNYRGLVAAHLARYKQFPGDARSRGDQGSAVVSFGLDGGGRVTSVRIVRSSGHSSLDQETQAMVRRASPFPAPPSGRPQSFTVPINFALR